MMIQLLQNLAEKSSKMSLQFKNRFLRSHFSYLIVIAIFLFVLISLQRTYAQSPVATPAAPPVSTGEPAKVIVNPPVLEAAPSAPPVAAPTVPPSAPKEDPAASIVAPPAPAIAAPIEPVIATVPEEKILHEVVRRIVVFPIHTDGDHKKEADLAWWKVREILSDQQRFLVATKRYMQQNEVFQPRKTLLISDVVLLAKLLESDCLITTYLDNKKIYMQAYSGQDGLPLWKKSIDIVASKPISQQLESLSAKLVQDFLATLPYQGFQIVDPLNQQPLIEEGTTILARVDVGARSSAAPGQKVQWLEIERSSPNPLFQGGAKLKVIAEGEVIKNENQVVTVEVKRVKDIKLLDKKSIIAIPDEYKRIYDLYAIRSSKDIQPNLTLLSEPMRDAKEKSEETRPLLVALSAIANVVVAVLLAL